MKTFSEKLNEYINELNCSALELSKATGLSASAISRYRSGAREPEKNSDVIDRLAHGIRIISLANGKEISEADISAELTKHLSYDTNKYKFLSEHFDTLVSSLSIPLNDLAKHLNFDASYLSRIRNGQRTPANPDSFVYGVCHFVVKKFKLEEYRNSIAATIGCDTTALDDTNYYNKLIEWFCGDNPKPSNHIESFLKNLDEFDLNTYIKAIHFDELKVPTMPFRFPTSKNYYGVEQMKQGELDFFKGTVLSKSMQPIFMCSDMPMADMAEDTDFAKKWMFAIAMSLKKGLHLDIIHNIDRSFEEMMLGLESWIPIYMTGQISPYHLPGISTNIYHHINYVSGTYALSGECINGQHNNGKYYVTNNKEEVEYYRKKANDLLKKAEPLMNIYTNANKEDYDEFESSLINISGNRYNLLSSLPLYTLSDELLNKILSHSNISIPEQLIIKEHIIHERSNFNKIISHNDSYDEITTISKEEFDLHPMHLSIEGTFIEKEVLYTYDEFLEHAELTKQFAANIPGYNIKFTDTFAFRNIQIHIIDKKLVVISKIKSPAIHFVIRHNKMIDAITNFVPLVIE